MIALTKISRLDDDGREVAKLLKTASRAELLDASDVWKEKLKTLHDEHPERSHSWRVMTLCKVSADGLTEEVCARLTGKIKSGDEAEHSKRCAYLAHFLNNGDVPTDQLINTFQPWFCREWRQLAGVKIATHLPILFRGHKGSCWSLGWRLEQDSNAKDDLKDLADNLNQACYHRFARRDQKWLLMVAGGLDVWQQRTGLKLKMRPMAQCIYLNKVGFKAPRRIITVKKG